MERRRPRRMKCSHTLRRITIDVNSEPEAVSILVEDKATFGGTSQIKLIFDPAKFTLKQWQVTDPQGYETLVSLFNVDLAKKPDPRLFQLTEDKTSEHK